MTQHILITGASRGIGAAIADRLSGADAQIYAVSSKDFDLGKPDGAAQLWEAALDKFSGRIDVLINNAGVFENNPLDQSEAD